MNNRIVTFVLALVSVALCVFAQAPSTVDERYPMPVVTSPILEFGACATPTLTMTNYAVKMNSLPVGSKGFIVSVNSTGAVHYGGSTITPAVDSGYPMIGTSTEKVFYTSPLRTSPAIYFCTAATGTTPIIRVTPFK